MEATDCPLAAHSTVARSVDRHEIDDLDDSIILKTKEYRRWHLKASHQ